MEIEPNPNWVGIVLETKLLIEQLVWCAFLKDHRPKREQIRCIFKLMTTPPHLGLWEFDSRKDPWDFHSIGQFISLQVEDKPRLNLPIDRVLYLRNDSNDLGSHSTHSQLRNGAVETFRNRPDSFPYE